MTFEASVDQLLVGASLYWLVVANQAFLGRALSGQAATSPQTWMLAGSLAVGLTAIHVLLAAPLATRWTVKPLLAALTLLAVAASHFIERYGTVLDPAMIRNVLATDPAEAGELMGMPLWSHMAWAAGPALLLLWRVRVARRPWARAVVVRLGVAAAAALVLVAAVLAAFQPLSSLMRNQRELRYQITPANVVWSLGAVAAAELRGAAAPRRPIGLDARAGTAAVAGARPRVVVLVVGETARAANWGLGGYARDTTPQLRQLPVLNFRDVTSCGTDTETSLPCMFAPVGRRDYDEARIRGSESLLHVLARAGVQVHWLDNQSGCKGVCEGLPFDTVARTAPALCDGERCLDEGLLQGLDERLARATGTQLWVLHMLGNHGPSYFRRYPPAFERFVPACRSDDLRACSRQEIVNAYDNALLYTDHVLATLVRRLQAHAGQVDATMLYVSDHGESLGEGNLFLHGMPHAIAPEVQTKVPMVWWLSDGFAARAGLDAACLRARADAPARHDHLFHTLLTLTDVTTALHEPAWDLTAGCRRPVP